jgi:hypothetical protein
MWAAKDNGSNINWANAKIYCENYRDGGYTDWRLPTQDELAGLFDKSINGNNGCYLTTTITLVEYCCAWTSNTRSLFFRAAEAAYFNFDGRERHWHFQWDGHGIRALPVRSVK